MTSSYTQISRSNFSRISLNEDGIADEYFQVLESSYFAEGIKKVENRWLKCEELYGDYVEKLIRLV